MPKSKTQQFFYSFITVAITVWAFIFYSLFVVNNFTLNQAVNSQYIFGIHVRIYTIYIAEFVLALSLELLFGHKYAMSHAIKLCDPAKYPAFLFNTVFTCFTACFMCPMMSLFADLMYFDYAVCFLAG